MSMAKSLAPQNSLISASRISLNENPRRRFQQIPSLPFPRRSTTDHARSFIIFQAGKDALTFTIRSPAANDLLTVHASNVPPPAGPPPPVTPPPPSSWKNWAIGILMTIIIPLLTTKGGAIKLIMKKLDTVVQEAETIVEEVEMVAEKVEKLAEEIEEKLPAGTGGGKLKKALDYIEVVADKVEKDAHLANDFIDKVEEMEDKVESMIEPMLEQAKELDKQTSTKRSSG